MRRREFITLLGGAVAVWPLGASRAAGIPGIRIQYASWSRFTGLNEAGYVAGQNVAVEYRWAENQLNRLPALAADLVRRQVALGTGGWGDEIGAALTRGESGSGFTIFNVQRL